MNKNLKISVIGLGYVGLPTALAIAQAGHSVIGFDKDESLIKDLNNNILRISEKGFSDFFENTNNNNSIIYDNKLNEADIYIIAVPTPIYEDKIPNLDYVNSALKSIMKVLKDGDSIILESTSPIGTTESLYEQIKASRPDLFSSKNIPLFNLAYCPERILPGNLVFEIIHNDRIIGGINEESSDFVHKFYESFTSCNLYKTTSKTAELVKLCENSYRDVNIAFANELSLLCDEKNIDVKEVISLANKHPRVDILNPGIGVGGHCIPVDPWFIVNSSKDHSTLIKRAREINDYKTKWTQKKITQIIDSNKIVNSKIKIGILGITYKPNINDIRESPSLKILNYLIELYPSVMVSDGYVYPKPEGLTLLSREEILEDADIIFILTKHKEYDDIINKKVIDFS